MQALLALVERRPFAFALGFAAVPYAALRGYIEWVMHADQTVAAAPGDLFLLLLLAVGAGTPAMFLVVVVRRLVAERAVFRLRELLEVYFAAVLVFAVTYAVLQAGSLEPSFAGMVPIWGPPTPAGEHVSRLHAVFGDALYLSIVTMTTVGYGDLVPLAVGAKALAAAQGLLGIGFVGLVLGQYFSSCMHCDADGSDSVVSGDSRSV